MIRYTASKLGEILEEERTRLRTSSSEEEKEVAASILGHGFRCIRLWVSELVYKIVVQEDKESVSVFPVDYKTDEPLDYPSDLSNELRARIKSEMIKRLVTENFSAQDIYVKEDDLDKTLDKSNPSG